jgi:hypothetical protein
MSHESRELAEIYSTERVERARRFLQQRQQEAEQMEARVQAAHTACRELKCWLERVEGDEEMARSEAARLKAEVEELLPTLNPMPTEHSLGNVEVFGHRTFAAE